MIAFTHATHISKYTNRFKIKLKHALAYICKCFNKYTLRRRSNIILILNHNYSLSYWNGDDLSGF